MFRVALLSLLVVAANAADFLGTADIEHQLRKLQFDDFDLDAIQFNFAGVNFNAATAQELCPSPWSGVFGCLATKCPQALDVCPDLTDSIPDDYVGTLAPTDPMIPAEGGDMTMVPIGVNDTKRMRFLQNDEVPDCETLDEAFCNFTSGEDLSECCLTECVSEIQDLLTCVILEQTGEDRSNCEVPDCPTPAPVEMDEDPAPSPDSAAGSFVSFSRVFALAASVLAFAVL